MKPWSMASRLLSAYRTLRNERIWVLTEATDDDGKRLATTILAAGGILTQRCIHMTYETASTATETRLELRQRRTNAGGPGRMSGTAMLPPSRGRV